MMTGVILSICAWGDALSRRRLSASRRTCTLMMCSPRAIQLAEILIVKYDSEPFSFPCSSDQPLILSKIGYTSICG